MEKRSNKMTDAMMLNYDKLFHDEAKCTDCGKILNFEEIRMHSHVIITTPADMSCQSCWMEIAYGTNKQQSNEKE